MNAIRSVQLPYAIRDGLVVDIRDVESGLQPDCHCPVCGSVLVAKKGSLKEHHFAHHKDSNCAYAAETMLHLAAKQVIAQERRLMVPATLLKFEGPKPSWEVSPAKMLCVDSVRVESRLGSLIPDVIVSAGKAIFAIEVTVTHQTDDTKVRTLGEFGCSVLEIDLSSHSRFLSLAELKRLVIDEVDHKIWRFSLIAESIRRDVQGLCEPKPFIRRGVALHVDDCPIPARVWRGKPYANVIDDCWGCKHCVVSGGSVGEDSELPLLCLGRRGITSFQDWRAQRKERAQEFDAEFGMEPSTADPAKDKVVQIVAPAFDLLKSPDASFPAATPRRTSVIDNASRAGNTFQVEWDELRLRFVTQARSRQEDTQISNERRPDVSQDRQKSVEKPVSTNESLRWIRCENCKRLSQLSADDLTGNSQVICESCGSTTSTRPSTASP